MANLPNPTRICYNVIEQLLVFSKRRTFVRLTGYQEVTSMEPNCGKNFITKRKMRLEAREKKEPIRLFGMDGRTIRLTQNSNKTLEGQVLG